MRILMCLLAFAVLGAFALIGCEPQGGAAKAPEAPKMPTGKLTPAKDIPSDVAPMWPEQAVWPTGDPINPKIYLDYNGKRIYFPNEQQKKLFQENPEKVFKSLQGVYGAMAR